MRFSSVAAAALTLCSSPILVAQSPDHVLRAVDTSGTAGIVIPMAIALDFRGDPLQAYRFEVCDDELVSLEETDVAFGATTSALQYSAHVVEVTTDGWTVDAALDVGVNELDAGTDLELYLASYFLLDIGTSTIDFCEASVTSVLETASEEIGPTHESGSIEVLAPIFLRGDVDGDGLVIPIVDARRLVAWGFAGADEPPCMEAADINNNGLISALVDGLGLLNWAFSDSAPPADPGPDECGPDPEPAAGEPCEIAPDPCVAEFDSEPNPDYVLSIASETAATDSLAGVAITLSSLDEDVAAYQFSVCHDGLVTLEQGDVLFGDSLEDLGANPFLFHAFSFEEDSWTVGALLDVMSPSGPIILEAGAEHELYVAFYRAGDVKGGATLEFCEIGSPLIRNVLMASDNTAVVPEQENGAIEIVKSIPFTRGDADGDGEFSGLFDAIFVLEYGFLQGKTPPCLDAADADDSGDVDGLLDAIRILNYAFVDGPAPPDPGPDECGGDPTGDAVDCATIARSCQ